MIKLAHRVFNLRIFFLKIKTKNHPKYLLTSARFVTFGNIYDVRKPSPNNLNLPLVKCSCKNIDSNSYE